MALENELTALGHLITEVINPANLKPGKLNNVFISECRLLANNEKERVKNLRPVGIRFPLTWLVKLILGWVKKWS